MSCVVLSKVVTTATAGLAASRRFKDASAIILMVPVVLMGPVATAVAKGATGSAEFLPVLARNLAWTPLGAAWALGGDVAAGNFGAAVLKLLIALATLTGLFVCWKALLERALVTPAYAGAGRKRSGGLGLFKLFPATPAGAVTARSLTYWLRDPRYAGSLIVVPLLPALLIFQASQTGSYALLSLVGPLTAFLLAWSISSDVSYDSTAFALHMMTGVRGVYDRWGRVAPCLVLGLPLVLAFTVIPCLITGAWDRLPGTIGLSLGVLFTGLGLSSVVSARYSVTVPLPGESPFKKPPGNVAQTMAVHSIGAAIMMVLVAPEAVLVAAQHLTGNPVPGWINLVLGPVLGLGFLVAGVRLGGRWMDARGPELLAQLAVNR
ncbi:MAG TPA: transporter, partial [Arthrobacter sp.]